MQTATLKTAGALAARRAIFGIRNPESAVGYSLYSAEHKNAEGDKLFVVYSYGPHYPLYLYNETTRTWYVNMDQSSRTIARHRSSARPSYDCVASSTAELKEMLA